MRKIFLDGRAESADGTIVPVGLHGAQLPIGELLQRILLEMMKAGHMRAKPPFARMPRANLLEWYHILLDRDRRAQRHRKQDIVLNLPADAEAAPNDHLVAVVEELWLLGDTFRLQHVTPTTTRCCDETSRLLSTPARCETVPWCDRCALSLALGKVAA